jgi:hypothetical protein
MEIKEVPGILAAFDRENSMLTATVNEIQEVQSSSDSFSI